MTQDYTLRDALDANAQAHTMHIRIRALDAARRELHIMTSELRAYGECFTPAQLLAMRKVMRALQAYIKTFEG